MKALKLALLGTAILVASGCASVPKQSDLSQWPIVTYGDKTPAPGKFILHFPAGQPIPTDVAIVGNLLTEDARTSLVVSLNRDIYVYEKWVSFDGTHWMDARDVMSIAVKVQIPGYRHPTTGKIQVSVEQKVKP